MLHMLQRDYYVCGTVSVYGYGYAQAKGAMNKHNLKHVVESPVYHIVPSYSVLGASSQESRASQHARIGKVDRK